MLCSVSYCDVFWDVERGADYNKRALVLPIYGEGSAQPTEGLTGPPHLWGGVGAADGGANWSSPFMGRCRSSRRRGYLVLPIYGEVSAQPTEGLTGPSHLWGGVGAADEGACSSGLLPTVESARRGLRRRSSCPRSAAPPRRPRTHGGTSVPRRAARPPGCASSAAPAT